MIKFIFVSIPVIVLIGCNSPKRVIKHNDITVEKSYHVPDSTIEPGYDPKQRAFYWYLMSLNEKERKEWTEGAYSEIELHEFIERIDSL